MSLLKFIKQMAAEARPIVKEADELAIAAKAAPEIAIAKTCKTCGKHHGVLPLNIRAQPGAGQYFDCDCGSTMFVPNSKLPPSAQG